jgi:hypothetical protein
LHHRGPNTPPEGFSKREKLKAAEAEPQGAIPLSS